MSGKRRKELLEAIERLGNASIYDLRQTAATGVEGRYSPSDAKVELHGIYRNRGALIALIIDRDFLPLDEEEGAE